MGQFFTQLQVNDKVDDVTIERNALRELQVKTGGVTDDKMDFGTGSSRQLHIVGCVIRYSATLGRWGTIYEIDGSGHRPLNVQSISSDTSKITLTYDTSSWGANIEPCSFTVTPDEELASQNLFAGASVGTNFAYIYLKKYAGVTDYIYYNGSSWVSYRSRYSLSWNSSGHYLKCTRLLVDNKIGMVAYPQLTPRSTPVMPVIAEVAVDYLKIQFYDSSGNLMTSPSTDMKVLVSDMGFAEIVNPHTCEDLYGNLWILGLFTSDR